MKNRFNPFGAFLCALTLALFCIMTPSQAATRTITVTASPADKGSVRGAGTYEEGETVYLVAVPNSGRLFLQWSDGNTSNPRQITIGTDPDNYTAEFGAADFEYHFDWASDVNASNSGRVMTGSYSNKTFYINRVSIWKDYVTNNDVGYPGINIDMCAGAEGTTFQSSYNYGNGKFFANPGSYSTIQDYCPNNLYVSNTDAGRIIGCSHKVCVNNSAQSFECYTKLYLSALEEYQIESGSKIYFAPQSTAGYPFIWVQGTFGTTSAFITIGTAPVYTITLNDQGATTSGTASVTVTFGESTNLLTPITKPKKTGYRFMGYSGRSGNTNIGYRVIDKDGYFMPNKRAQTPSSSSAYVTSESMQWIASADVTLYAVWEEGEEEEETPTYTVTWKSEDGLSTLETDADLAADAATSFDGETPTKDATAQYNYTFDGWATEANGAKVYNIGATPTVSGDATYYAHFSQATRQYTITVNSNGHGTVSGSGTYDYGTSVPLTATPDTYYNFSSWSDDGAQNHNVTVTGTATYTASFALNTSSVLNINDNGTSDYYSTILSAYGSTEMDICLRRTFYAGVWNTVCFPFALTSSQIAASDMSGVTFYTLSGVEGNTSEGLDFIVDPVSTLSAKTPYLVKFEGSDISNPVFHGVTLAASAFTNNTSGTDVDLTSFYGTVHPTSLGTGEESGYLFLRQDGLYWPNVAHDILAFRAYFYSGNDDVQQIHPRVRLVIRQTPTDVEEAEAENNTPSVRKYIQNGILVIERDGVRYSVLGEQIQ